MHNDNTPHSRRDDDAAASGITRRQWLQGALALTVRLPLEREGAFGARVPEARRLS